MPSFARLAVVSCSTKRSPTPSGGKVGAPTTYLTGLHCTPLDPVDPELRHRLGIETPHELLQAFLQGAPDIREGDILVVGSVDYPVRAVSDWVWKTDTYRHLILEDLKV